MLARPELAPPDEEAVHESCRPGHSDASAPATPPGALESFVLN